MWIQIRKRLIGSTLFAFTYIRYIYSRRHKQMPFSGGNLSSAVGECFSRKLAEISKLTDNMDNFFMFYQRILTL